MPVIAEPDPTPLSSARAVVALYGMYPDHEFVDRLVRLFGTWGDLVHATPAERHAVGDAHALVMRVPSQCPEMPPGIRAITRYDDTYPSGLRELAVPPVVLFVRGQLDAAPAVVVDGAQVPSPQGVEIARSAVLAATVAHIPVLIPLGDGTPMVALRTAVPAQGHAIVLLPHAIDAPSAYRALLEGVLNAGGAIVSTTHPAHMGRVEPRSLLSQMACAMGRAVVLAEVGLSERAGLEAAKAAVEFGRYLIVPAPQPHHVPDTALGLGILTDPRQFDAGWYGTSPRIEARIENARPPADAVVTSQAEIAAAISVACAVC